MSVPLSDPGWTPVWAMPNVTIDEPVETSLVALVSCQDERVCAVQRRHSAFNSFLNRFRDEFGSRIWPSIMMVRNGAPDAVRTVAALGGFRDAICTSAIVASHSKTLKQKRGVGI